jgi:uncharacterized membrane protein YgaE (UPF0421/DUF939 family)
MAAFFLLWLNQIEWKIAIKTGLTASLSLTVALTFNHLLKRPDSLISGLWTVLSSIVVIQAYLESTYNAAWARFLGVFVGSCLGGIFTSIFGASHAFTLGISIFFTIVACSMINLKESFRIACLSVAVVNVLWGLNPNVSPWVFAFFRFIDSCIGIFIAIIISHILWPFQAMKNMRKIFAETLSSMNQTYMLVLKQSEQCSQDEWHRLTDQ